MDREELLQGMDLKKALFGTFFVFNNRLQAAGDSFYEGITVKQFFLLICLSVFKEDPTIKELSRLMGSTHQNVKVIADKLERKGYIRIYKDDADRRKLRVALTEKMREIDTVYEEREEEFMKKFYAGPSEDELETTYKTIIRLEQNLIMMREEMK